MDTVQSDGVVLSTAALEHSRTTDKPTEQFKRHLRFRGTKPGELVALEAIGPSETNQKYKYAASLLALSTMEQCLIQLLLISETEIVPRGCFIHQNEVNGWVAARQKPDEWVKLGRDDGLKEEDIASRRAFYFDFDPKRGKNISSTDTEMTRAYTAADAFLPVLTEILGDDDALGLGASGNGVHIHVALDSLPNNAEVTTLVRGCLVAAAALVTDPEVSLDVTVSDPRRICPAFGTVKRKGTDHHGEGVPPEEARPHRRTAFICKNEVRRLSLDELHVLHDELVARAGVQPPTTPSMPAPLPAPGARSAWDDAKAIDIEKVSDWLGLGTGVNMTCPGCGSIKGYGRVPNSNITKCHHNSCSSKGNPNKPGTRTTIDLVAEAKSITAKEAVNALAAQFGFAPLGAKPAKQQKTAAPAPPPAPAPTPPPAATGAKWEDDLLKNDNGEVLSTGANVELVLKNDPAWLGILGFNELRNAVVFLAPSPAGFLPRVAGDEWRDDDDVACCNWLSRQWGIFSSEQKVRGQVSLVAHWSAFHPIRTELLSLKWDGVFRVDRWLSVYLGVEASSYATAVGRWWLTSAVARVMQPGCKVDTMLILEGPQGARKSSALRALAGDDYFLDDLRDVGGVESAKQLCGKWIVELSELDALRKAESSTIKRYVSQQSDNYRPSYGRTTADYPRQCVFAGTTDHEEYLQDETGARRFWPVLCGAIDIEAIKRDRNQLWAEAVTLHMAGEKWWPETPEEIAMCTQEQANRQTEDTWDDDIAAFVFGKTEVTTRQILADGLGVEVSRMKDSDRKRVGAVLRGLGWNRSKKRVTGGTQQRVFVRPLPDPDASLPATTPVLAKDFAGPIPVLSGATRDADAARESGAVRPATEKEEATAPIGPPAREATKPAAVPPDSVPSPGTSEPSGRVPDATRKGELSDVVRVVDYSIMLQ